MAKWQTRWKWKKRAGDDIVLIAGECIGLQSATVAASGSMYKIFEPSKIAAWPRAAASKQRRTGAAPRSGS
jgi:hypothetical protein